MPSFFFFSQIMALNMFIIEHTKVKAQDPDSFRTVSQNSALQVTRLLKSYSVSLHGSEDGFCRLQNQELLLKSFPRSAVSKRL
jgi:hypothetical protein